MKPKEIRYIDLFCGIGGFRLAVEQAALELGVEAQCVFSCDIDENCQEVYEKNFKERPKGDIETIKPDSIPNHEILLAGFPCQPFSIIGNRKGFDDTRGTLFFNIAQILEAKKPEVFVLENVKLLAGHNRGNTLSRIMACLRELGYQAEWRVLNALQFGLPQKRERIFIIGFKTPKSFSWPEGGLPMTPLKRILEKNVAQEYYASEYIRKNRLAKKLSISEEATIWHENKAGHVSAYPYSCALRAGASYNYLLVNGERRLTAREMLRLQGFPDSFKIECTYSQARKQAGNSLPVPVAKEVLKSLFMAQSWHNGYIEHRKLEFKLINGKIVTFQRGAKRDKDSKVKDRRKI